MRAKTSRVLTFNRRGNLPHEQRTALSGNGRVDVGLATTGHLVNIVLNGHDALCEQALLLLLARALPFEIVRVFLDTQRAARVHQRACKGREKRARATKKRKKMGCARIVSW